MEQKSQELQLRSYSRSQLPLIRSVEGSPRSLPTAQFRPFPQATVSGALLPSPKASKQIHHLQPLLNLLPTSQVASANPSLVQLGVSPKPSKRVTWKDVEPESEERHQTRTFGQWIRLGEAGFLSRTKPHRHTY